MANTTLHISGMHCAACTGRVERKLMRLDGVSSAAASLATHSVYVQYDDSLADVCTLADAITSAGFVYVPQDESIAAELALEDKLLRRSLRVALIFGLPVFVLAMLGMFNLAPTHDIPLYPYFELVFSSVVFFYSARPFYRIALPNLKKGVLDMNTLIVMGTASAYCFSVWIVLAPSFWAQYGVHMPYFESVVVIVAVVLLGRVLESRAKSNVAESVTRLLDLAPKTATIVTADGGESVESVANITRGMTIRLRPGSAVPVDGRLIGGTCTIDESILTGEAVPVDKLAGDAVYTGTHVASGSADYTVTGTGADTVLASFIRQVEEAVYSKAPVQRLADKIAAVFVPVVMGVAAVSFVLWLVLAQSGELPHAILAAISVLIIACPCALGLATPSAIMAAAGRGAKEGMLIRNGEVLENAGKVDTVVFDKTGTLTTGIFTVYKIEPVGDISEMELLKLAAAAEHGSEHPLAKAIVLHAKNVGLDIPTATSFDSGIGGVSATVLAKQVLLGTRGYLQEHGVAMDTSEVVSTTGYTVFYAAIDNKYAGQLMLGDTLRPESASAIEKLKSYGIRSILLSGDNRSACERVAAELGIDEVYANAKPADKRAKVIELKQAGKHVAMVGDGINDAAALSEANVGIAMAQGSDIAISSADITLVGSDIAKLPRSLRLARLTGRTIRQNLFWAFIYNVLGIPIAAGVLYPLWQIQLTPAIGGVAMAFSSVTVLTNALRLRTVRIG